MELFLSCTKIQVAKTLVIEILIINFLTTDLHINKIPNDMYKCICSEYIEYKDNSSSHKSDEVNIGLHDIVTALAMYKECPPGTKFEILSDKDSEKQQSAIVNRLRKYAEIMEVGDFFMCLFSGKVSELHIQENEAARTVDIRHIAPCFFVKNFDETINHSFSDTSGACYHENCENIGTYEIDGKIYTEIINNKESRILFDRCIDAIKENKDLLSVGYSNRKTRENNLEETSLYYNNFDIQGQRCGNCAVLSVCSAKSFCKNYFNYVSECKRTGYEKIDLEGFRSSIYYSTFIRDIVSKSDEIFCYAVINNDSIKNKINEVRGDHNNFNGPNIIVSSKDNFDINPNKNDFLPIYDHGTFLFAIRRAELHDNSELNGFNSFSTIINIAPGVLEKINL